MKPFKGKTFVPPVEKERKEVGKYKEKLDNKFHSSHRKISSQYRVQKSNLGSTPTNSTKRKKKLSTGDYILLGSLVILSILFIFLIVTVIIEPSMNSIDANASVNETESNKEIHDEH